MLKCRKWNENVETTVGILRTIGEQLGYANVKISV